MKTVLLTLIVFSVLAVLGWHIYALVKLHKIEKLIFEKEEAIDKIPENTSGRTSGSLVTQGQLDKLIIKEQAPLMREIELLEKRRKFIIEKAPLIGVFKK
jgi:hypothetical protein